MKNLTRGTAPACLSAAQKKSGTWDKLTQQEKTDIWSCLLEMQSHYCAYCECRIHKPCDQQKETRHIDHFYPKGNDPKKTFEWDNLFGSCSTKENCGHYSQNNDKKGACKPDRDTPEKLFSFSSDGKIAPKHGLSQTQLDMANKTIEVFNLNSSRLTNSRKAEISSVASTAKELLSTLEQEIDANTIQDIRREIEQAKENAKKQAFSMALFSVWE
jgi:uncharacterized protein (TIGR02646 family)